MQLVTIFKFLVLLIQYNNNHFTKISLIKKFIEYNHFTKKYH
jgi:hypothetical protein